MCKIFTVLVRVFINMGENNKSIILYTLNNISHTSYA